jgi:hypothetical protein
MAGGVAAEAAACVIVTGTPAIEIVALRSAPELGATARTIEVEVVTEKVIQLGTETVQEQEALLWVPMVMLTVKPAPEAGACNVVGETE